MNNRSSSKVIAIERAFWSRAAELTNASKPYPRSSLTCAIRRALRDVTIRGARARYLTGILAATALSASSVALPAPAASAESAAIGGDGSEGFVLDGSGGRPDIYTGNSVGNAGDVNGDGIDDLIVGAPLGPRDGLHAGQTYIVLGRSTGYPALFPLYDLLPNNGGDGSEGFALTGIREYDFSGHSVSTAGDVNGDGIDDLFIGAPGIFQYGAGEAYVVFGRSSGFSANFPLAALLPAGGGDGSDGFILKAISDGDRTGYSVSAAGDVNGDGIVDLIVGAPEAPAIPRLEQGASYVVFGRSTGFPAIFPLANLFPGGGGDGSEGFVLKGNPQEPGGDENSGYSVADAGDVNGDGVDDLIIGAPHAHASERDTGGAYVVFGRTTGFAPEFELASLLPGGGGDGSAGFVVLGINTNYVTGNSVSGAGDVNADGIDDLVIGAWGAHPDDRSYLGEGYVVFGRMTGFPAVIGLRGLLPAGGGDGSEGFVLRGVGEGDNAGRSVSGAGDLNNDGVDDLIVGAPTADRGDPIYVGQSYVVFGRTGAFPPVFELRTLFVATGGDGSQGFVIHGVGEAGNEQSGRSVAGVGDVNADGIDDMIIGAIGADEAYVIFGRATGFPAEFELSGLLPP